MPTRNIFKNLRDRLPASVKERVPEEPPPPQPRMAPAVGGEQTGFALPEVTPEAPRSPPMPIQPSLRVPEGPPRVMPEAQHAEGWTQWEMGDPVVISDTQDRAGGVVSARYTAKPQEHKGDPLPPYAVTVDASEGAEPRGQVAGIGPDYVIIRLPIDLVEINDWEALPRREQRRYRKLIEQGVTTLAFAFDKRDVVPWLEPEQDVSEQEREWGGRFGMPMPTDADLPSGWRVEVTEDLYPEPLRIGKDVVYFTLHDDQGATVAETTIMRLTRPGTWQSTHARNFRPEEPWGAYVMQKSLEYVSAQGDYLASGDDVSTDALRVLEKMDTRPDVEAVEYRRRRVRKNEPEGGDWTREEAPSLWKKYRLSHRARTAAPYEEQGSERAAFIRKLAAEDAPPGEAPGLEVISPNIVETTNFTGACALHGEDAPEEWRAPWCGGRSEGLYEAYGGGGRSRYIVYPDGPDDYIEVEGVGRVPVAKRKFTVSVKANGTLSNINDSHNRYSHHADFDRKGGERVIEILRAEGLFSGGAFSDVDWSRIPTAELWADAGFTPDSAQEYGGLLYLWSTSLESLEDSPASAQLIAELEAWRETGLPIKEVEEWMKCGATPLIAEYTRDYYNLSGETVGEWQGYESRGQPSVALYAAMMNLNLRPEDLSLASSVEDIIGADGSYDTDASDIAEATLVAKRLGDDFDLDYLPWVMNDPARRVKFVQKNMPSAALLDRLARLDVGETPYAFVRALQQAGIDPETGSWAARNLRALRTELGLDQYTAGRTAAWTAAPYEEQLFGDADGLYPVPQLQAFAEQHGERRRIPMAELAHNLEASEFESDDEYPGTPAFIERAEAADLAYPILVVDYPDGLWIADGVHRLWKANAAGHDAVDALVIPHTALAQFMQPAEVTARTAANRWPYEEALKSDEAFELLDREVGEGCDWMHGGCGVLAETLRRRLGGDLWMVVDNGIPQHVVLRKGDMFFDRYGPKSEERMLRALQYEEGLKQPHLEPVDLDKLGEIPWRTGRAPAELTAILDRFMQPVEVTARDASRASLEVAIEQMARGDRTMRQQLEETALRLMGEDYTEDEVIEALREERTQAPVLYEDARVKVVEADCQASAQAYGYGSGWCIRQPGTLRDDYHSTEQKVFVLLDKTTGERWGITINDNGGISEIVDQSGDLMYSRADSDSDWAAGHPHERVIRTLWPDTSATSSAFLFSALMPDGRRYGLWTNAEIAREESQRKFGEDLPIVVTKVSDAATMETIDAAGGWVPDELPFKHLGSAARDVTATAEVTHLKTYLRDRPLDVATWWPYISEDVLARVGLDEGQWHALAEEMDDEFYAYANQIEAALTEEEKESIAYRLLQISPAEAPSWTALSPDKYSPGNRWLVSFTDSAWDIQSGGFTRGVVDPAQTALTTHLSEFEKDTGGGYGFAFDAGDAGDIRAAAREGKYGKEAVMFRALALSTYHSGDQERQLIFWGPDVDPGSIVVISEGEGANWGVPRRDDSDRFLYQSDDIMDVVDWVQRNEGQYRRQLFAFAEAFGARGAARATTAMSTARLPGGWQLQHSEGVDAEHRLCNVCEGTCEAPGQDWKALEAAGEEIKDCPEQQAMKSIELFDRGGKKRGEIIAIERPPAGSNKWYVMWSNVDEKLFNKGYGNLLYREMAKYTTSGAADDATMAPDPVSGTSSHAQRPWQSMGTDRHPEIERTEPDLDWKSPVRWRTAQAEVPADYLEDSYLRGQPANVEQLLKPGGHGLIYLTPMSRVRPGQTPQAWYYARAGELLTVKLKPGGNLFDPLNDETAAEVVRHVAEKHGLGRDLERMLHGMIDYDYASEIAKEALPLGFTVFEFYERAVQSKSLAVSDPNLLEVVDRRPVSMTDEPITVTGADLTTMPMSLGYPFSATWTPHGHSTWKVQRAIKAQGERFKEVELDGKAGTLSGTLYTPVPESAVGRMLWSIIPDVPGLQIDVHGVERTARKGRMVITADDAAPNVTTPNVTRSGVTGPGVTRWGLKAQLGAGR